jgi:hypothetical protein
MRRTVPTARGLCIDRREVIDTVSGCTDCHINQSRWYCPHHTMVNIDRQVGGAATSLINVYKHTHKIYGLIQPTSNIGK